MKALWMVTGTDEQGRTHVLVADRRHHQRQDEHGRAIIESDVNRDTLQHFARRYKRARAVFGRMAQIKTANSRIALTPGTVYQLQMVQGRKAYVATALVVQGLESF